MQKGTIKTIMDKGFGFIEIKGRDNDLFFHSNELQNVDFNDLQTGDTLEFEIVDAPKGQSAVNVSKV